jgi:O-antigen/teichoic acid export membrane protein
MTEDAQAAATTGPGATTSARAFRGGLWQSAAQFAPYVFTTVVSIVAARALGPDRMGRQSFIAFVIVTTQTLWTGGLGSALVRHIGEVEGRGRERTLPAMVAWGWKTAGILGGLGALVLVGIAVAGATPAWAWLFAAVAALAGSVNRVPGGVLIGMRRWQSHALVVVVIGAAQAVITVAVVLLGAGVTGMIGVTAAAAVAILIWVSALAHRQLAAITGEHEPLGPLRAELVSFSLAMSVPVILSLIVFQRSELFFLERFSSNRQIALYSIAFSATAALYAVPTAIGAILTPSVATLVGSREFDRIRRGYSRVIRLGLLFSLPLTGVAMALGPSLLHLIYGSRYEGVGDILLIILLTLPITPLAGASNALLIGYGRVRAPIVVGSIAAAVDVVLALLLVPRLDAVGAAIANTAAFLISGALVITFAGRQVGRINVGWHSVLRVATISALAGGLAWLVLLQGDSAILVTVAAAIAILSLGIGALTTRVISAADAAFLVQALRGGRRLTRVFERLAGGPLDINE